MVLSLRGNRPIAAMGERAGPGRRGGTAEGANARESLRLNTIDGGPLWRASGLEPRLERRAITMDEVRSSVGHGAKALIARGCAATGEPIDEKTLDC